MMRVVRAKAILSVLLAAAGASVAWWLGAAPGAEAARARPGGEPTAARTQAMGIRTERVRREALAPTLSAPGYVAVDPAALLAVSARAAGWIVSVPVSTGQRVRRGDVLATTESPDLAAAQRTYIEAAKWADSVIRGGGRADAAQEARLRLERLGVAPEDLDALTKRLEPLGELPIRAPVSGFVWSRRALPGTYVQPGAPLFEIADLSRARVVIAVAQTDAPRVKVGQVARFSVPSSPDGAVAGRVRSVAPAASAQARTVAVSVALENSGPRLLPGTFGEVTLEVAPVEGLAIPVEAVIGSAAPRVLVRHEGGRLEPRPVRLGLRAGDRVQVIDGLAEGEEIVASAGFLADSESGVDAALDAFAGEASQGAAGAR